MEKPLSRSGLFTIAEKDEFYQRLWLENEIQEVLQSSLGVRKWVQYRSAITVLARFGYFAVNNILNVQSPGEEFCDAKLGECSVIQRLAMILLNNDLKVPKEIPRPFVNLIKDAHLITFYLFGDHYLISKRATGVSYISLSDDTSTTTTFELINNLVGFMSIVKLILNLSNQHKEMEFQINGREAVEKAQPGEVLKTSSSDLNMQCHLCSSLRIEPTATLCGHLFCWTCIHNWLKERNECPVCRMPTEPSRLIHLINFK